MHIHFCPTCNKVISYVIIIKINIKSLLRRPNSSAALERHDSIVTDSLLQMTSFTPSPSATTAAAAVSAKAKDDDLDVSLSTSETGSPKHQAKDDMDKV